MKRWTGAEPPRIRTTDRAGFAMGAALSVAGMLIGAAFVIVALARCVEFALTVAGTAIAGAGL